MGKLRIYTLNNFPEILWKLAPSSVGFIDGVDYDRYGFPSSSEVSTGTVALIHTKLFLNHKSLYVHLEHFNDQYKEFIWWFRYTQICEAILVYMIAL